MYLPNLNGSPYLDQMSIYLDQMSIKNSYINVYILKGDRTNTFISYVSASIITVVITSYPNMNNFNITINGDTNNGNSMSNSIHFTPAETINNRREAVRNPNVRALNWDELFVHFADVVKIRKPATYIEEIRTNPANNVTYIKKTTKKVEKFNKCGYDNIEQYMAETGVKQSFERYADGSADELLQPMTNVINIGALHNTWIMINPRDPTIMAKIATTPAKRDDYIKLGYRVLEHEVDSINTIQKHAVMVIPLNSIRQEAVKIRRETWTYVTKEELIEIVEKGTETYLPALDWDASINSKSKENPGCLFSKESYHLMLQHYCGLHLPAVTVLHPNLPWKGVSRKAAVESKATNQTYLEWARDLAIHAPLYQPIVEPN